MGFTATTGQRDFSQVISPNNLGLKVLDFHQMTPEEMAKGMEPWMAWKAKYGEAIVDLGAPLGGGQSANTRGTWSQSSKNVTGYSIVQSESLEGAKAMFVGHPHLSWSPDSTIEIHEAIPM